ncbi:MAG TPA: hypothetical protein PKW69_05735, partial [Niabella sp.]|nr:hypothetical protein [Niabella sp.]
MKFKSLITGILMIFFIYGTNAQKPFYFTSTPTLTPKGDEVIFSYNGQLWRSSVTGGTAYQITSLQGISNRPRVSP